MNQIVKALQILILTVLGIGITTSAIHFLHGAVAAYFSDYPLLTKGNGFTMPDVNGRIRNSDELVGQVILLNFWATWCPPCRQEIPGFIKLHDNYHHKGLIIVGIAIDEPDKVRQFMQQLKVDYLQLVDEAEGMNLAIRYGDRIGGLPYSVIIDRSGKVVFTRMGELSATTAEKIIVPLL